MRRFEAMEAVMAAVTDERVVCNIGHPCQELFLLRDRPENFYMLGSMGLASSIGLGLAICCRAKVVAIEGDGAVLMNMGSLATIGATRPKNYVLAIIDNGAYGSTGFQTTFAAKTVDLEAAARACGIPHTTTIDGDESDVRDAMASVLSSSDGPWCVVIKALPGKPDGLKPLPMDAVEIRNRFMEAVRE